MPKIKTFDVIQSLLANIYIANVVISDSENNDNLIYNISVLEDLNDGTSPIYKNQTIKLRGNRRSLEWPTAVFRKGRYYTFRLTVFDGWNIVIKEVKVFTGETKFQIFLKLMHWNKWPATTEEITKAVSANLGLLAVLYAFLICVLYLFSPLHFVLWHEAVANSRLPYPEKLSKFLVLNLVQSKRSLNAFVKNYLSKFIADFETQKDVETRLVWVPSPFTIDNHDIITFNKPDLDYTPGYNEVVQAINAERMIISIEGQGGIGKSSFAFQIAQWAYGNDKRKLLTGAQMLPVFINNLDENVDSRCKSRMEYITNRQQLSDNLASALLTQKKVIVVIDGVSEMPNINIDFINPEKGGKLTHCLVMTSRKPVQIRDVVTILPMGLKLSYLDSLINGFTNEYVGANKFEDQREILRIKIKEIITNLNDSSPDRPVPLIVLKLMISKAAELIDAGKSLATDLPDTLPSLFEIYIEDILRKRDNVTLLTKKLRELAIITLGLNEIMNLSDMKWPNKTPFKPQWVSSNIINKTIDPELINIFITDGFIIQSGSRADLQFKLGIDLIGDYLVAEQVCINYRDGIFNEQKMSEILTISKVSNASLYSFIVNIASLKNIILNEKTE